LEAKRQRRRDGRETGRRRTVITEAEFLARRESVSRTMVVRQWGERTQVAVLEDDVLVEHYVSRETQASMIGNVYLGRVQNVLPSMEAAFVDIGRGRNAVLYAGEVNWGSTVGDARRIETALNSGDQVMVQVIKDPIGHKGARLTSQISLPGRYLVLVPAGGAAGISRKLPQAERQRIKRILRKAVPDNLAVIVRTAAEGASEEELSADIARLTERWTAIQAKAANSQAPCLLKGEPDVAIRVVRDVFNDDFKRLIVSGENAWSQLKSYVGEVAPDLMARMELWTGQGDIFAAHRIDEQIAKAMDRKVWLPSGGSLVIDRTEAMTVVDVNTGRFTGTGGTLEETVTKNNLEAAEEIVRQLRLRDIGGIIVIDFIDMVLGANRDLVLRRLVECLGRDRTRHQVAEVTSLGLVQMTRKRVGQGLLESFSNSCEACGGRGLIMRFDTPEDSAQSRKAGKKARRAKGDLGAAKRSKIEVPVLPESSQETKDTMANIAAAATVKQRRSVSAPAGPPPSANQNAAADPPIVELPALVEPAPPVESTPTASLDSQAARPAKSGRSRRSTKSAVMVAALVAPTASQLAEPVAPTQPAAPVEAAAAPEPVAPPTQQSAKQAAKQLAKQQAKQAAKQSAKSAKAAKPPAQPVAEPAEAPADSQAASLPDTPTTPVRRTRSTTRKTASVKKAQPSA
jgi:ribonuclease E